MAFEIQVLAGNGDTQRIVLGSGRTVVTAQPGSQYRLVADDGAVVQGASVRRFGNDLVVQGLPEGRELELDNYFGACRPGAECTFALDALGAPAGSVLTSEADPLAALRDGSFLLYGTAEGGTTAVIVPATAAGAGESGMGTLGMLGAGFLAIGALAAAAGGGGGGDGGGDGGARSATTPPPAAVADDLVVAPAPDAPAPPAPGAPPPPPAAPPPAAPPPELASFTVLDNRGREIGPVDAGGTTDDLTPRITLRLDDVLGSGQTLTLRRDDGTTRSLTEGSTLDFDEARLERGSYTYTAEIADAAGNVSVLDLNGALLGSGFTFVVI